MIWRLSFEPLLPLPALIILAIAAIMLTALLLFGRTRGSLLRGLALGLAVLALFNPVLIEEEREPLTSVAAIVVDQSDSQNLADREAQTERALETLKARLDAIPNLETRIIETDGRDRARAGTALFGALERELSDVPPDRVAGAVIISDGQVHDIPKEREKLGFSAPVHGVITGEEKEFDQRLVLTEAPRFGIVGEEKAIKFRVESTDPARQPNPRVKITLNGEQSVTENVPIGVEISIDITIERGGKNILEIALDEADGELTAVNNRAIQTVEGIRENLRVLLVSGEPHAGERTWRNLLKSDASVDLVHFTILRPPEKQRSDSASINELSLIAFPTRELFAEKIQEFDLIIFDRYKRRGVLPTLYFDNIARYVEEGGAILVAAGPDYSGGNSIYQTLLEPVLPAQPVDSLYEQPFHAKVTKRGFRHPVTRNLDGAKSEPPAWSRWFRIVDVVNPRGDIVMEGPDNRPLLILNREQEGRVALMLSDHAWLWARGFEGGGPHIQLLRRLSHWLMKEPDLEEEALRGFAEGDDLVIERQTMSEEDDSDLSKTVTVTRSTGDSTELTLEPQENGLYRARLKKPAPGLYTIVSGDLRTLAHMGPPNPKEFQEVVSTGNKLAPLADASGGRIFRTASLIPRVIGLKRDDDSSRSLAGRDWLGLKMTNASVLKGVERLPLFAGLLGLALLLGAFAAMWYREGR